MAEVDVARLVEGVKFVDGFGERDLLWDGGIGFLRVRPESPWQPKRPELMRVVGFCGLTNWNSVQQPDGTFRSITSMDDLDPEDQTKGKLLKGAGLRVANTKAARRSAAESTDDEVMSVCTVELPVSGVRDWRPDQGGIVRQLLHQAMLGRQADERGLHPVVDEVHEEYGDVDGVVLWAPPVGRLQQLQRGVLNPRGIRPELMIVRDPDVVVHVVGSVAASASWE